MKRPAPNRLTWDSTELLKLKEIQRAQKIVNHRGSVHYLLAIQKQGRVSLTFGPLKRYQPDEETLRRVSEAGDLFEVLEFQPMVRRSGGGGAGRSMTGRRSLSRR
jgi:hypothetical protein